MKRRKSPIPFASGFDMISREIELQIKWKHPGGKLREEGAAKLTDQELLAIIISTGIKGKSAEDIANEILNRFGSLDGLANQPLENLLEIKGLSDVKIIRIAAAYELAMRLRKGKAEE